MCQSHSKSANSWVAAMQITTRTLTFHYTHTLHVSSYGYIQERKKKQHEVSSRAI